MKKIILITIILSVFFSNLLLNAVIYNGTITIVNHTQNALGIHIITGQAGVEIEGVRAYFNNDPAIEEINNVPINANGIINIPHTYEWIAPGAADSCAEPLHHRFQTFMDVIGTEREIFFLVRTTGNDVVPIEFVQRIAHGGVRLQPAPIYNQHNFQETIEIIDGHQPVPPVHPVLNFSK